MSERKEWYPRVKFLWRRGEKRMICTLYEKTHPRKKAAIWRLGLVYDQRGAGRRNEWSDIHKSGLFKNSSEDGSSRPGIFQAMKVYSVDGCPGN